MVEDAITNQNSNDEKKYESEDSFIQDIEKEEEEIDIAKFNIFSYPADPTLLGYCNQWDRDELYIPDFQRNYVWDEKKASRLIESFILGLPVPPVFLYKPLNENRFWVIDGHQRIRSIVSFIKGYFVYGPPKNEKNEDKKDKFKLKGVTETKLEGKNFNNLEKGQRFQLENSIMRSIIIKQLTENDNESIYPIFERLNTGGINLSHMEVRMCISHGRFANFLKKLNEHSTWRTLLDKPKFDRRYRDIEWILRVIALSDESFPYTYPMKNFLNKYMEKNANATQEWLNEKGELFKAAVEKAILLGKNPFRIRSTGNLLNLAVMDSILVALISLNDKKIDKEKLKESYNKLMGEDSDYFKGIESGVATNHKDKIKARIESAKKEFLKIV